MLTPACERAIGRDQRDRHRDLRAPRDAREDVRVARDERALRDDPQVQPRMLGEHLEDAARHPVPPLRRLVRIGGGADEDHLPLEEREMPRAAVPERARERVGGVALHHDVPLESEPRRDRGDGRRRIIGERVRRDRALHHVAMRVARVAVRASERTAGVRIHRPIGHPRHARVVEDVRRVRSVVRDVVLLAEHRELPAHRPSPGRDREHGVGGTDRHRLRGSGSSAGVVMMPNKHRKYKVLC